MVGGLRLLIDPYRLHADCKIDGDEDEIAMQLRFIRRFLFVDLERRRMRLAGMGGLPRIDERRRAFLPSGTSMTAPGTLWYPGKCFESSANWFSPRLPASSGSGKLFAISCRQSTSKSAIAFACWTMRRGSTLPSTPRHHWTFQVMSFIE